MAEYEVVDFDGAWLCVLRNDGVYLIDPSYLEEFIKKNESSD